MREIIELHSEESSHSYTTTKNKRTSTEKLVIKKYDPIAKKHCTYTERKVHKGKK